MPRDLRAMKNEARQVEPSRTVTFAVGGRYRCPDERCGETALPLLVPHPKDETCTPNRCPTCLTTAVRDD